MQVIVNAKRDFHIFENSVWFTDNTNMRCLIGLKLSSGDWPPQEGKASNCVQRRCGVLVLFYLCNSRADAILVSTVVESQKAGIIWFFSHPVPTEIYSEVRHRMGWVGVSKHTSTNTGHPRVTCHFKWWAILSHGHCNCWMTSVYIIDSKGDVDLNIWPGSCFFGFLTM